MPPVRRVGGGHFHSSPDVLSQHRFVRAEAKPDGVVNSKVDANGDVTLEKSQINHAGKVAAYGPTGDKPHVTINSKIDANGEVTLETSQVNHARKMTRTAKVDGSLGNQKLALHSIANKTLAIAVGAKRKTAPIVFAVCVMVGLVLYCIVCVVLQVRKPPRGEEGDTPSYSLVSFRKSVPLIKEFTDIYAVQSDDESEDEESDQIICQEKCADTGEFANSAVLKSGRAWKLNHGVEPSMESLSQIRNWRRRDFFFKRTLAENNQQGKEKVGLLLISEKDGGLLRLLAMLQVFQYGLGTKPADVAEMEEVKLQEMDEEIMKKVATDLHDYAVAFHDEGEDARDMPTMEDFQGAIPKTLFPISITWTDESQNTCTNIISMESEKKRQTWMKALRSVRDTDNTVESF